MLLQNSFAVLLSPPFFIQRFRTKIDGAMITTVVSKMTAMKKRIRPRLGRLFGDVVVFGERVCGVALFEFFSMVTFAD